jgi:hypothetical protein
MVPYQDVLFLQPLAAGVALPICSGRHTLQGLVVVPVAVLAAWLVAAVEIQHPLVLAVVAVVLAIPSVHILRQ